MNPFQTTDQHASDCYAAAINKAFSRQAEQYKIQVKEAHTKAAIKYGQKCLCEICNS